MTAAAAELEVAAFDEELQLLHESSAHKSGSSLIPRIVGSAVVAACAIGTLFFCISRGLSPSVEFNLTTQVPSAGDRDGGHIDRDLWSSTELVEQYVSFIPTPPGNCTFYAEKSKHCDGEQWNNFQKCGACFNAGARSGVMCKGSKPGYSCPPDKKEDEGDMAFACMDWTFGSSAMRAAEASFNARSGHPAIYFGVGTYGVALDKDPMGGLGMCLELQISGVDRPIVAQSINTGHDVAGNQFDLQIGAGGVGIFNTCAGNGDSMFPGSKAPWGRQYGGLTNRSQCAKLPTHPHDSAPMRAAGDSLIELCHYAWDKNVYSNPSISSITRVQCPPELVNLTQLQRSDEAAADVLGSGGSHSKSRRLANHECKLGQPGAQADWCLTRMMDCRKPSGAIKDNIRRELVAPGHRLVQPCLADGYTRIDVQCGCHDCYC